MEKAQSITEITAMIDSLTKAATALKDGGLADSGKLNLEIELEFKDETVIIPIRQKTTFALKNKINDINANVESNFIGTFISSLIKEQEIQVTKEMKDSGKTSGEIETFLDSMLAYGDRFLVILRSKKDKGKFTTNEVLNYLRKGSGFKDKYALKARFDANAEIVRLTLDQKSDVYKQLNTDRQKELSSPGFWEQQDSDAIERIVLFFRA